MILSSLLCRAWFASLRPFLADCCGFSSAGLSFSGDVTVLLSFEAEFVAVVAFAEGYRFALSILPACPFRSFSPSWVSQAAVGLVGPPFSACWHTPSSLWLSESAAL